VKIFTEFRERRIVQIVLSYLAAGWVFLEVIDQFTGRNVLPEPAYYVALVWFLLGIPAAFLVGWNHGEKGKQTAPRSEIVALSALGVAALVLSGYTVVRMNVPEVDLADYGPDPNHIAVLYFETPQSENQYIADGLTEALIQQLGSVPVLDVVSRNGVSPFQGTDIPRDSIARALDVGTLVGGVVEPVARGLQVTLQLYDGASGAPLPDGRVVVDPTPADSLFQMIAAVGEETSRLLRAKLGEQIELSRRYAQTNVTAWTLVQRAERIIRQANQQAAHGDLHEAFDQFDQAHELLARAQDADSLWAQPTVIRSQIEYRKSRFTTSQPLETGRHISRGLELANEALAIDSIPDAFASRGTLRYWKFLMNIAHSDEEQHQLLTTGREDLERAVRDDPTLASAYSVLSHLYFNTESIPRGVLAAQRAYDADAYLEAADGIVWRLYSGNADMENWTEARQWCTIGRQRFPADPGFMNCPLDLMVAGAMEPDPEQAWEIARQIQATAESSHAEYERLNATITVAGVLARAGLQDSARTVLDRASAAITPEVDVGNDLRWIEAQMRVLAGQEDQAIDILARLIAADPAHAFSNDGAIGWMWRPLRDHPRFHELQRAD
jgi:TolB-like protein